MSRPSPQLWATPVESWAARRADVLWTLFYAANWHFVAAGQDYFTAYTGASPLRHAWSATEHSVLRAKFLTWQFVAFEKLQLSNLHSWSRRPNSQGVSMGSHVPWPSH